VVVLLIVIGSLVAWRMHAFGIGGGGAATKQHTTERTTGAEKAAPEKSATDKAGATDKAASDKSATDDKPAAGASKAPREKATPTPGA
jgi:hypothetical protein